MAIDYNATVKAGNPLYLAKNEPLDIRTKVASLALYKDIQYPFIGMIFYAALEAQHYKVTTLANGFLVYSTSALVPNRPAGTEFVDFEVVQNAFVGTYSVLASSESSGGGLALVVGATPVDETSATFNTTYPNALPGESLYIDTAKPAGFLKATETQWIKFPISMLSGETIIPEISDVQVQPYK